MSYDGWAIDQYVDADLVNRQLDELKVGPVYGVKPEPLQDYVQNYFEAKCKGSKALTDEAKKYIPGGVQHNLAFNYPFPLAMAKAEGAYLYDVDGNRYYDLLQAGGPTVLGSNDPAVKAAVLDILNECGPSTGLFHEYELKLAKKISECVPSVEMFRMLGSGTEADMVAARIARLKTGHKNLLKMGGAYHGWSDQLAYGIRIPGTKGIQSRGIPNYVFKHTDEFFPGDLEDLERKLRKNKLNGGTAAVFIEAIGPESGTRPVTKAFVRGCERLAHEYGALLVCDEVVTGFRIGLGGAQGYFGIDPDLTVFGKVIAGGYPGAGGIGGHADCMAHLGENGGQTDKRSAGAYQKTRTSVRCLQPGICMPPRQRRDDAVRDQLEQALGAAEDPQGNRQKADRDGAYRSRIHGGRHCYFGRLETLHKRCIYRRNDRRCSGQIRQSLRKLRASGQEVGIAKKATAGTRNR